MHMVIHSIPCVCLLQCWVNEILHTCLHFLVLAKHRVQMCGNQLKLKKSLHRVNKYTSASVELVTLTKKSKKKSRSGNNNISSTAKLIRVDLSSIRALHRFISSLPKRASGITTTLIPLASCSPCCVKKESRENRNRAACVQSHYTLVSLKGQHISLQVAPVKS